jgi:hypothetical protein
MFILKLQKCKPKAHLTTTKGKKPTKAYGTNVFLFWKKLAFFRAKLGLMQPQVPS